MPYPGLLHPEPLPLQQSTADPYLLSEVKSLSRVQLFATPWTVAYQALPSMGFSRQEYWSGLPFPSPGYLLRRHSNTVLSQSVCGLWVLVHRRHVWALWASLEGMGFDSKHNSPLLPSCWGFSFALGHGCLLKVMQPPNKITDPCLHKRFKI